MLRIICLLGMGAHLALGASLPKLEKVLFPASSTGTQGALVIRDGKTLLERYNGGFAADTPHILWSASKNFTGALVGIAIERGFLKLDDSVCKFFPKIRGKKCDITVQHLLHWSSGLNWNEGYTPLKARWSSVIQMLYGSGADDMAAYTLRHKVEVPAGTRFRYSSGDSNVLMAILKKVVPDYRTFPWKALFEPLGIQKAIWETDGAGTFVGSSYLYLSPRDLAKFGALFLNRGRNANGKQVVPEDWIRFSTTPAPHLTEKDRAVGAQWWLNRSNAKSVHPYPAMPQDAILARGHWGQYMVVVPSEKLIFIRLGDDRQGDLDLKEATAALMEDVRRLP